MFTLYFIQQKYKKRYDKMIYYLWDIYLITNYFE